MKRYLFNILFLSSTVIHAQDIVTLPITQTVKFVSGTQNLSIDMRSSSLILSDFNVTDNYELYFVDALSGNELITDVICELKLNRLQINADGIINDDNVTPIESINKPILKLSLPADLNYGDYIIRVVRDNNIIRRRKLRVIEPDAVFSGMTVKYPDGLTETGQSQVKLNGNTSLRGMRIKLDGNIMYPKIKIGGIELLPDPLNKGYYKAGKEWEPVVPDNLEKIEPTLSYKRTLSDRYEQLAFDVLDLPNPKIHESLNNILIGNESLFEFKLKVENVYGNPKIFYKNINGGDLLSGSGQGFTQKSELKDGNLEFETTLNKNNFDVSGKNIEIIIENPNGKRSNRYIVTLKQNLVGVTATLRDKDSPYMAGFSSPILFTLAANEADINPAKRIDIGLLNKNFSLPSENISEDFRSVTGLIQIPEKAKGSTTFSFKYNNGKTILGILNDIKEQPKVDVVTPLEKNNNRFNIPVGQKFRLRSKISSDVKLTKGTEELSFLTFDKTTFESGEIVVSVSNTAPIGQEFSLIIKHRNHELSNIAFNIVEGIELTETLILNDKKKGLDIDDFSGQENLNLQIKKDLSIDYSGFKASLIDNGGNRIGEDYFLIANRSGYSFNIDVATTSIKPGDIFYVKLSNFGSRSIKRKYYYKRTKLKDHLSFSTGISAATFYLEEKELDDTTSLPNAEFINGINLTITYNPNGRVFRWQKQDIGKQPLGIALTFSAIEGDNIRTRLGIGINFFEKIVLGLDQGLRKGDRRAGIYVGAVSSFADIASLFGSG